MQVAGNRKSLAAGRLASFSGRKPLLLALTLGLLAAVLSWSYVRRSPDPKPGALVPVVVAASDIPVRTQVTAQMVTIKQVPADARHPKAFTGAEQLEGKVTNLPIAEGEQVLSTKFFARKEDSGLAFRVPPGKRAVSVNVNEVITSGGLIVPGDFVDVIGIFGAATASTNGEATAQDSATIALQNIEVLAVAQSLQGVVPEARGGPVPGLPGGAPKPDAGKQDAIAQPNARTATLAVTPEEAQRLLLAEETGKIRLALRAVDDHAIVEVPATKITSVTR